MDQAKAPVLERNFEDTDLKGILTIDLARLKLRGFALCINKEFRNNRRNEDAITYHKFYEMLLIPRFLCKICFILLSVFALPRWCRNVLSLYKSDQL